MVEVEYNLVTVESAFLKICSNWGPNSHNAMESSRFTVSKGSGKVRFILDITPKDWGEGSRFWILSKLDRASDHSALYNTHQHFLGVDDK